MHSVSIVFRSLLLLMTTLIAKKRSERFLALQWPAPIRLIDEGRDAIVTYELL